jgi:hypothetical protein
MSETFLGYVVGGEGQLDVRETGVVLQHVVAAQVVKREPSGIGLRICPDGKIEQKRRDVCVKMHRVEETVG